MPRRPRLRRTLKWTGTIACILLATVFVASSWCYIQSGTLQHTDIGLDIWIGCGIVDLVCFKNPKQLHEWNRGSSTFKTGRLKHPGLVFAPRVILNSKHGVYWIVELPLWIPLLVLGVPTAWLWRLDRRRPLPNHCRNCTYNLTANTSGRCPECGEPTMHQAAHPAAGNPHRAKL